MNRGIAQVAMLDDPAEATGSAWNRKLIYAFGGSCGGGHRQGTRAVGIMSPHLLSQGYAVASNSLNAFEQNCNDVIAAEAFAMTREHFIERHGAPAYTMGIGCSGGAAQAYQIADNYPGLLDGIVVGCSLADLGFAVGQLAFDARLLTAYAERHPGRLSAEQLRAVSGMESIGVLQNMSDAARFLDPDGCVRRVDAGRGSFRCREATSTEHAPASGTRRSTSTARWAVRRGPVGRSATPASSTGSPPCRRARSASISSST